MSKKPITKRDYKRMYESVAEQLQIAQNREHSSLTFDNLTICWSKRQVTWRGRTVTISPDDPDCLVLPITNDQSLLIMASRLRYEPLA